MTGKIKSVLIANRGEIAVRIQRTLKKMDIRSVMIFHELERGAFYLTDADEAFSLGEGDLKDTFLNIPKIIEIACLAKVDAIHPGYGFLSENTDFAKACLSNSLKFIGPPGDVIELMANKRKANAFVHLMGIPIIPQIKGSIAEILDEVQVDFFPCIVKASAGGGGIGMHVVNSKEFLADVLEKASREAINYFGNHEVFIEKYLSESKHIEVQILADGNGNCLHLYERDCSIQRRYQKVIEETPALSVSKEIRDRLYNYSLSIAKESNYSGAGTIEFLVDKQGSVFFLEMNTRIQVEHGITEMVTGIDIVEQQIRIASGQGLSKEQKDISIVGHAIEARIYAEDPFQKFKPSPGKIELFDSVNEEDVRIDHALATGATVLSNFDPLLAKVMVKSDSRENALSKMNETLNNLILHNTKSNLTFLSALINSNEFKKNDYNAAFVDSNLESILISARSVSVPKDLLFYVLLGAALNIQEAIVADNQMDTGSLFRSLGRWRLVNELVLKLYTQNYKLGIEKQKKDYLLLEYNHAKFKLERFARTNNSFSCLINGAEFKCTYTRYGKSNFILGNGLIQIKVERVDLLDEEQIEQNIFTCNTYGLNGSVSSPITGKILKINSFMGEKVKKGDVLLVIESMKMENNILSPKDGILQNIFVKADQLIESGTTLLYIE